MTDINNLEDLPYPMFETTEEEKEELRRALRCMFIHLCNRVESRALKRKIREAISPYEVLESYLKRDGLFSAYGFQLRDIWINKLLAYKGE